MTARTDAGRPESSCPGSGVAIALLGVGCVGSAFLRRLTAYERLRRADLSAYGAAHGPRPAVRLAYAANSTRSLVPRAEDAPGTVVARLLADGGPADLDGVLPALAGAGAPGIVVDATACPQVAARHAEWLTRGLHVVTASKLGAGESQAEYDAIVAARGRSAVTYGDAATVGAGLPVLRSIRELRAGADEVLGIRGVLSGSLAWLLDAYQAQRGAAPFSELVAQAQGMGLTEPDPAADLSGADVRRKLLILARAAGACLEPTAVRTEPLGAGAAGKHLDAWVAAHYADAQRAGRRLAYVATWSRERDPCAATVGLAQLAPDDPLLAGAGCDNRVVVRSTRYDSQPLVISGPGAGAEVTAAALVDDVLRVARRTARSGDPTRALAAAV